MAPTWPLTEQVPAVEEPGRQVANSLPFSAEVKNKWSCTSIAAVCLFGVESGNFTLLSINYD